MVYTIRGCARQEHGTCKTWKRSSRAGGRLFLVVECPLFSLSQLHRTFGQEKIDSVHANETIQKQDSFFPVRSSRDICIRPYYFSSSSRSNRILNPQPIAAGINASTWLGRDRSSRRRWRSRVGYTYYGLRISRWAIVVARAVDPVHWQGVTYTVTSRERHFLNVKQQISRTARWLGSDRIGGAGSCAGRSLVTLLNSL